MDFLPDPNMVLWAVVGALLIALGRKMFLALSIVPVAPFPAIPFDKSLHAPFLGAAAHLEDMVSGLQKLCVDSANDEGVSSFLLMTQPVVSVLKAEHVKKVLMASNFRGTIPLINKHLALFLGENALVLLMHESWRVHRGMMAKALAWQNLRHMVGDMCTVGNRFVQRLCDTYASTGTVCDVSQELKLPTLDTIGLTAFGFEFNSVTKVSNKVADAFSYLLDETTRRQFISPLSVSALFTSLPTKSNIRLHKEIKVLRSTVEKIIESRQNNDAPGNTGEQHHDILRYMMAGNENNLVSNEGLVDNLLTLLFGGFDTTSTALGYCLYKLAMHPEMQDTVAAEAIKVLGDRDPTYSDISEMKYMRCVMDEVLRLYPSAPLTVRTLERPLELGGSIIPAGVMVYMPIWHLQRHALNWGEDSEEFRPERHIQGAQVSSYRMIPFSGGQRNCVGERFARVEFMVLLATMTRRLRFSLSSPNQTVHAVSTGVVQKPKGGIPLLITKR